MLLDKAKEGFSDEEKNIFAGFCRGISLCDISKRNNPTTDMEMSYVR